MFDGGMEPSVGEWQKVAIARALLRDAPILILDELTSALDADAEQEVLQRFREAARGCTTILISHRFSTVQFADWIYVLESGRIIEQGSHEQLMRLDGTYARMFETQAQYYRGTQPRTQPKYGGV
jgi:ATP-binding cassette, subfamily B, bacterial